MEKSRETATIDGMIGQSPANFTGLYSLTSRSWIVVADIGDFSFVVMVFSLCQCTWWLRYRENEMVLICSLYFWGGKRWTKFRPFPESNMKILSLLEFFIINVLNHDLTFVYIVYTKWSANNRKVSENIRGHILSKWEWGDVFENYRNNLLQWLRDVHRDPDSHMLFKAFSCWINADVLHLSNLLSQHTSSAYIHTHDGIVPKMRRVKTVLKHNKSSVRCHGPPANTLRLSDSTRIMNTKMLFPKLSRTVRQAFCRAVWRPSRGIPVVRRIFPTKQPATIWTPFSFILPIKVIVSSSPSSIVIAWYFLIKSSVPTCPGCVIQPAINAFYYALNSCCKHPPISLTSLFYYENPLVLTLALLSTLSVPSSIL